jgi:hypothetical protein
LLASHLEKEKPKAKKSSANTPVNSAQKQPSFEDLRQLIREELGKSGSVDPSPTAAPLPISAPAQSLFSKYRVAILVVMLMLGTLAGVRLIPDTKAKDNEKSEIKDLLEPPPPASTPMPSPVPVVIPTTEPVVPVPLDNKENVDAPPVPRRAPEKVAKPEPKPTPVMPEAKPPEPKKCGFWKRIFVGCTKNVAPSNPTTTQNAKTVNAPTTGQAKETPANTTITQKSGGIAKSAARTAGRTVKSGAESAMVQSINKPMSKLLR